MSIFDKELISELIYTHGERYGRKMTKKVANQNSYTIIFGLTGEEGWCCILRFNGDQNWIFLNYEFGFFFGSLKYLEKTKNPRVNFLSFFLE